MSTTTKKITLLLPTLVVVFFAIIVIISYRGYLGYKLFTVMTGSMTPSIPAGSLIVVTQTGSYTIGDILTFRVTDPQGRPTTITHRLVSVVQTTAVPPLDYLYQMKGDANEVADSAKINPSQIVGKVVINLPFIGFFITFIKTPIGFVSLIIVPTIVVSIGEIKNIYHLLKTKPTKHVSA